MKLQNINKYKNQGVAYLRNNQPDKAIDEFKLALSIEKNDSIVYFNIGEALKCLGDYDEALSNYRKALEISPGIAVIYHKIGEVLYLKGENGQALSHHKKALQLNPELLEACVDIARLLMYQGESEQSIALLEHYINNSRYSAGMIFLYSNLCEKKGLIDKGISTVNKFFYENQDLNKNDQALVYFSLGRLLDKKHCYDDAFKYFKMANDAIYDPAIHEKSIRQFDLIKNDFNQTICSSQISTNLPDVPVFIVGIPRSGSTLIEQILSSHSQVCPGGELCYISDIVNTIYAKHNVSSGIIKSITNSELLFYANKYLKQTGVHALKGKYVTDKNLYNFKNLGLISLLFPKAKIISCSRDPKDVALSCYMTNFGSNHAYTYNFHAFIEYFQKYEELMVHWKDNLDIEILDIHYEDLIYKQKKISKKIIQFVGLEWEDNCLNFHKNDRAVYTVSHDQVSAPIYNTSVGRWKNYRKYLDKYFNHAKKTAG